jgi:hypothetical protein
MRKSAVAAAGLAPKPKNQQRLMTGVAVITAYISPIRTRDERCVYLPFSLGLVAFGSIAARPLARHWSAKDFSTYSCQDGVPLLEWSLRSINWLPFLEISQNCETGEGHQEMFERMSTEDKVRMDYMISELKQFGDGVQQRGDDPIESSSISRRE